MSLPTAYSWVLESEIPPGVATISARDAGRLMGRDIWFDLADPDGADRIVTPAGDWRLVDGIDALRQSLLRRLVTDPGEWATLPDYGVGARSYVKARDTAAARAELISRIKEQFQRDARVEAVRAVLVKRGANGVLRIRVEVMARSRTDDSPLVVAQEVA